MGAPSFWDLPHSSKMNELREGRHDHLIDAAFNDSQTWVARVDNTTFMLYGPDEALLLRPQSLFLRVGCELYCCLTKLFSQPVGEDSCGDVDGSGG